LSARARLPGNWSPGTTKRYFEQLDEAWADFRIEIEGYRELGEWVVALGVQRGAGMSSQIEVAGEFVIAFRIPDSRIVILDAYDNWSAAVEAAGLRD
jgi:hypothetical protein